MTDPGHGRRLVVPPARGNVPAGVGAGTRLPAGATRASIRNSRAEVDVSATYDGVLAEWPAHHGDTVDAGAPLARQYPEVSQ